MIQYLNKIGNNNDNKRTYNKRRINGIHDLAEYMMTSNPYKQPDSNQAIKHPFFLLSSEKNDTYHYQSKKNSDNFDHYF